MKPWWQVMQMGRILSEFGDDAGGGSDDLDEALGDDNSDDLDDNGGPSNDDDLDDNQGGRTPAGGRVAPVVQPVDPAEIARAVAEGLRQTQQPGSPQGMTEEEFRKATDYFEVNPEMAKKFASLLGIDTDDMKAKEIATLLQGMLDGVAKHTLKSAGLMQGMLKKELSDRVVGLETNYQRQQTQQFFGKVISKYGQLAQHQDILPDILNALKASGARPANETEAIKIVAKAARDHIRRYIPGFMSNGSGGPDMSAHRQVAGSITGNGAGVGGFGAGSNRKSKADSLPDW